MKKLTAVMDSAFQDAQRNAFRNSPAVPPVEGDIVFIWDHYWPGKVIKAYVGDSDIIVSTMTALDGEVTLKYTYKQVRICTDWELVTDQEATQMSKMMDD